MLSIPLFINLLPKSELIAFDPNSNPAFARIEANPLPPCIPYHKLAQVCQTHFVDFFVLYHKLVLAY